MNGQAPKKNDAPEDQAFSLNKLFRYSSAPGYVYAKMVTGKLCEVPHGSLIGYCTYSLHPGWLDRKRLKAHDCLGKKCPFLKRYNKASYWDPIAEQKAQKQKDKELRKQEKLQQQAVMQTRIQQAQEAAEHMKLYLKIYDIRQEPQQDTVTVFYASYFDWDDSASFRQLEQYLRQLWQLGVRLRHIKNPDGSYAVLW